MPSGTDTSDPVPSTVGCGVPKHINLRGSVWRPGARKSRGSMIPVDGFQTFVFGQGKGWEEKQLQAFGGAAWRQGLVWRRAFRHMHDIVSAAGAGERGCHSRGCGVGATDAVPLPMAGERGRGCQHPTRARNLTTQDKELMTAGITRIKEVEQEEATSNNPPGDSTQPHGARCLLCDGAVGGVRREMGHLCGCGL